MTSRLNRIKRRNRRKSRLAWEDNYSRVIAGALGVGVYWLLKMTPEMREELTKKYEKKLEEHGGQNKQPAQ